ncbi:MAG: FG-GAP-like repeat-containing protein, partial [Verrucomicrobia bacterium]|nr:FG-GAP-like repeat-containing protein [Verrucomicrobiota bacterium]
MNRLHLNLVVVVSLVLPRPFGVAAAQVEYTFTTLAGSAGSAGSANGVGGAARFNNPEGVVVDSAGNVFVADRENKTIRKITPGGVVSTFAGSLGISAVVDGSATAARFDRPSGMAVDSTGNLFVSDSQTIRRITPGGVVSTLAGLSGNRGSVDGTGTAARFAFPQGVAVDSVGNIYVADWENHTIRKITPARVVSTLAGMTGSSGGANGTGNAARFQNPVGVAVDSADNLYVTDSGNRTVRKITPSGVVSTLAGLAGSFGTADGPGSVARFGRPIGVAVDSAGNVFVTDQINETIRKITPDGVVSTLAGSAGNIGSANGRGSAARFNLLGGVAVDSAGNLYVADIGNNTIRKGTPEAVGPPSITTQPQNQTVAAGTDATLRVDAFGTTPLAYQWLLNSVALVGQTNATLTLGKALPVHSGVYKVAVRNSLGTLESQAAQVTVEWQARFDRVGSSDFPDLLARSVAVGDFDNDGLEDLFFANSSGASRLYRNLGSGQFAVVSTDMLSGSASGRRSGVWADYDNDGNLDLFVTRLKLAGGNLLFMNRGNGSFEEVGVQAGLGHIGDSYAAAWGDYDRDGFVDLFVANGENQNNLLYRNRGDGTFEQITAGPIVNDAGNSTGASWGDYDEDGWPDLAVSNQLLPSGDGRLFLYHNNRDGTFSRVAENPVVNTLGDSWGVSWADTDRDGDLDLLVVNDSGESDYLLCNDGKNNFTRIEAGSLTRDARDGLAGLWGDYNNDGHLDALVTGFGGGPDQLHRGLGGNSFTNLTSLGSAATSIGGFGAAWFDLEGDGDLDSVITASDVSDVTRLGRNSGNDAAWLRVKLEGRISNRSAIGAVVRVRAVVDGETVTQMRQVEGGSGVSSQNSLIAHFGLSDAGVVESLRVEWPSGMITERTNVPVRQLLLMEELPLGAPVVRVNGRFDPSNRHEFVTREPVEIKLQSSFSNAQIFYTLDSSAPDAASAPYDGPFRVTPPAVVRAIAYKGDFTAETQGEPVHLVFLETYQVTDVTPGGGGVILNPAGGSYLSNSIVSVTATPLAGWAFLRWEGSVTGTNPVATLRVDGPKSVQAVFGTLVTVTAVGGAANGSATVQPATGPLPYGSVARLSAIAAPGKYFLRWNLVGVNDTTLTNSPLNFVITNAIPAFTALFGTLSAGNFALNLQVDGAGSVTKSPALA